VSGSDVRENAFGHFIAICHSSHVRRCKQITTLCEMVTLRVDGFRLRNERPSPQEISSLLAARHAAQKLRLTNEVVQTVRRHFALPRHVAKIRLVYLPKLRNGIFREQGRR